MLNKMSFTRRHWALFLPFFQDSYRVIPRAMFRVSCSFEIVYEYLRGDKTCHLFLNLLEMKLSNMLKNKSGLRGHL